MKYCKKCRVSVPGDLHTCPLCQGICPAREKPGALLFLFSPHPQAFTRGFCG